MTLIVNNPEARKGLLEGMRKLSDAVTVTMGAGGQNAIFTDDYGTIRSTKDGVTVAKMIGTLENPIEDYGAKLLKSASLQTARDAGDGTTTSTLLAYTIARLGLESIANGSNAVELKRGIEAAKDDVIAYLRKNARAIAPSDLSELRMVANLSTNGDSELADLIVDAVDAVGADGVVTIEESRYGDTRLDIVQGIELNQGYLSHHFVTEQQTMKAELNDVVILHHKGKLSSTKQIIPALEYVSEHPEKSLLVIADDVEGDALKMMIINRINGVIKAVAVKAPDFGEKRVAILEDVAILSGGTVVAEESGKTMDEFDPAWFGTARKVIVTQKTTTLIDAGGDEDAITKRALDLKSQWELLQSDYDKQRMQERIGRLAGAVAVVNVSGGNDVEIKERKDRAEDALFAVYSAREEGYLPGGGVALLQAISAIAKADGYKNEHYRNGAIVLASAMLMPFNKIMSNAGVDPEVAILQLPYNQNRDEFSWGVFDPLKGAVVDAKTEGILDPMKVTRCALENAVATAGMIMITGTVLVSAPKQLEEPQF